MLPEKRFYYFKTKANFEAKLTTDEDKLNNGICFIEDTLQIYTHGKYFSDTKNILDVLTQKQGALTAGDNIHINTAGDTITISSDDTTYTLGLNNLSLELKDNTNRVVSSIDLSSFSGGGLENVPYATATVVGGFKLNKPEEGYSSLIDGESKEHQLVPSKGKEGDILTFNGARGEWKTFNLLDVTTYGVSWIKGDENPHVKRIGNMNMHRELPIQSGMKGCVYDSKNKRVVYWLLENDWRFRENAPKIEIRRQIGNTTIINRGEIIRTIPSDYELDVYDGQYVRDTRSNAIGIIKDAQVNNSSFMIEWVNRNFEEEENVVIELGSVLSGYHGEVMVRVPEFWIKSFETEKENQVRISPTSQDSSWEHQPEIFVGAYRAMMYFSTQIKYSSRNNFLSGDITNTPLSISNYEDAFRQDIILGGQSLPDASQSDDVVLNPRGKCFVGVSPDVFLHNNTSFGNSLLSYKQYKNIMYWLYVIEYASFSCFDGFVEDLTPEGFRKGGLGGGLSGFLNLQTANLPKVLVPNGYTNEFGNKTNIKIVSSQLFSDANVYNQTSIRWRGIEDPFGHVETLLMGVQIGPTIINGNSQHNTEVRYYTTEDKDKWLDISLQGATQWEEGAVVPTGDYTIKEYNLGKSAELVPSSIYTERNYSLYRAAYNRISIAKYYHVVTVGGNSRMGRLGGIGSFKTMILSSSQNNIYGVRTVVVPE